MRLVLKERGGYLEQFDALESFEEVAIVLKSFPNEGERLIFRVSHEVLLLNAEHSTEIKWKDMITQRSVFEVNEWLPLQDQSSGKQPKFIWFCPKDHDELIEAIRVSQLFTCAVLQEGRGLEDVSYVLQVFENIDFEVLDIDCRVDDDFRTRIIPRLQALLPIELVENR